MKIHRVLSLIFSIALIPAGVFAADQPGAPYTPPQDMKGPWAFVPDSSLPDVLILGDSISIGYTLDVRERLKGKANVYRPMRRVGKNPDNCGDTTIGLDRIDSWLGEKKWDVIHFNWGLWDLCYRSPESKAAGKRDKENGTLSTSPEKYEKQLEDLVKKLQATGANLIWASTTLVPEGEVGRVVGDDVKYNTIAKRVMDRHQIPTNDLHGLTKEFPKTLFVGPGDVHFTKEGSAKLGEQVAAVIEGTL